MKKILMLTFLVSLILCSTINVKAETFKEEEFIKGEFINKVDGNKTYFLTLQFIRDKNGNIVYCLEPFAFFSKDGKYTEYISDLTSYKKLSKEQKRRVSLIAYYGYGYGNRLENKWYAITQYMIWKEVAPNNKIYFTDKLNGKEINKYRSEIDEINKSINDHEKRPVFSPYYEVNYGDTLVIPGTNGYKVIGGDNISFSKGSQFINDKIVLNKLYESTYLILTKDSNYYKNKVVIYDSGDSQDLIRPGNVINEDHRINIKVNKGDIKLEVESDNSVYTKESSFKDTCYQIDDSNGNKVSEVCSLDDSNFKFETGTLPYGLYKVKQTKVGKGYLRDNNIYEININNENPHPNLILNNKLIRNKIAITKYYCKYDDCKYEKDASFVIKDKFNNVVSTISTNVEGKASIELGYGTYSINQVKGMKGYTLAKSYTERIVDESHINSKDLYNYYIEVDVPKPPKTRVRSWFRRISAWFMELFRYMVI